MLLLLERSEPRPGEGDPASLRGISAQETSFACERAFSMFKGACNERQKPSEQLGKTSANQWARSAFTAAAPKGAVPRSKWTHRAPAPGGAIAPPNVATRQQLQARCHETSSTTQTSEPRKEGRGTYDGLHPQRAPKPSCGVVGIGPVMVQEDGVVATITEERSAKLPNVAGRLHPA